MLNNKKSSSNQQIYETEAIIIIAVPDAKPLKPSIIFIELIIPTIAKMVKTKKNNNFSNKRSMPNILKLFSKF